MLVVESVNELVLSIEVSGAAIKEKVGYKLPFYERTAEGEEGHPGISQQKGFLEESNLSQLVLGHKTCHGH